MWIPLFCRPTDIMRSNPPHFHRPFGTERTAQYLIETGTKKYSSPTPYAQIHFPWFRYPWSSSQEAYDLFWHIIRIYFDHVKRPTSLISPRLITQGFDLYTSSQEWVQ